MVLAVASLGAQSFPALGYKADANWPSLPPGWNFKETAGVAVDAQDHVYVIHRGDHPIMEFEPGGRFLRSFGDGLFDRPHAVRVDAEGYIWAVDDGSHTVVKFDRSGRVRMVLGRYRVTSDAKSSMPDPPVGPELRGLRDDEVVRFNRPTDIAFGANGDIFVADGYGNSRVVKFAKDGRFLKTWGKRGKGDGEFHTPHSIAVDRQGRVYVADRENYRVQIFDSEGRFLGKWDTLGAPWGLELTRDGHLLMADGYNNRVLKLTLEGKAVGGFGSHGKVAGTFHYCHQIAMDSKGAIYTAEILNWRPQKFVLVNR